MEEIKIIFYPEKNKQVTVVCEVAKSFLEKTKGLMNRSSLPKNHGMLFPFRIPWFRVFWMKHVKIPLDIVFINKDLKIINIHEAPVETGLFYKYYCSYDFCRYIIECNMGFCKKNNISKGTKISIEKMR
jgi:uncharacterized membrane protein (UPF0127 family)